MVGRVDGVHAYWISADQELQCVHEVTHLTDDPSPAFLV